MAESSSRGSGALHRASKHRIQRTPVEHQYTQPFLAVEEKRSGWAQRWKEGAVDHSELQRGLREALEEEGPGSDLPPLSGHDVTSALRTISASAGRGVDNLGRLDLDALPAEAKAVHMYPGQEVAFPCPVIPPHDSLRLLLAILT